MTADVCPHSDALTPETCSICLKHSRPKPANVPAEGRGPRFEARYSTRCPTCDNQIDEGDFVRMIDGEAHHDPECT